VGGFAGVVLADSVIGIDIMAGYMVFIDSVSYCGYCRGGVSGAD
jgi:hypothetical protein